jgi:hypothetical protein
MPPTQDSCNGKGLVVAQTRFTFLIKAVIQSRMPVLITLSTNQPIAIVFDHDNNNSKANSPDDCKRSEKVQEKDHRCCNL